MNDKDNPIVHLLIPTKPGIAWGGVTNQQFAGDTLVIDSKMEFRAKAVSILEKRTLSEDGKTLAINRHLSSSQGEGDMKTVLEKQ